MGDRPSDRTSGGTASVLDRVDHGGKQPELSSSEKAAAMERYELAYTFAIWAASLSQSAGSSWMMPVHISQHSISGYAGAIASMEPLAVPGLQSESIHRYLIPRARAIDTASRNNKKNTKKRIPRWSSGMFSRGSGSRW